MERGRERGRRGRVQSDRALASWSGGDSGVTDKNGWVSTKRLAERRLSHVLLSEWAIEIHDRE